MNNAMKETLNECMIPTYRIVCKKLNMDNTADECIPVIGLIPKQEGAKDVFKSYSCDKKIVFIFNGGYLPEQTEFYKAATDEDGFAFECYEYAKEKLEDCKQKNDADKGNLISLCGLHFDDNDTDIRRTCVIMQLVVNAMLQLKKIVSDADVRTIYKTRDKAQIDNLVDTIWSTVCDYYYGILSEYDIDKESADMYFSRDIENFNIITKCAFLHLRMDPEALYKYGYSCWAEYYYDRFRPELFMFRHINDADRWVVTCNIQKFECSVNRLTRLISMKAPNMLIQSEYNMSFERLFFLLNVPVGRTEHFLETYGFSS